LSSEGSVEWPADRFRGLRSALPAETGISGHADERKGGLNRIHSAMDDKPATRENSEFYLIGDHPRS
jgi:hypothetical protein